MKIALAAIGKLKAGPERELVDRFLGRAAASGRAIGVTEVAEREFAVSRAGAVEARRDEEARALIGALPAGARLVALDERGASLDSDAFAAEIGKARDAGAPAYVLALGGPDGHGEVLRRRADRVIGFGRLTWPHALARVLAAEQVYRAMTILSGHPYHRG